MAKMNIRERLMELEKRTIYAANEICRESLSNGLRQKIEAMSAHLPNAKAWPPGVEITIAESGFVTIAYPNWIVEAGESVVIDVIDVDGAIVPARRSKAGGSIHEHPELVTQAPIKWYLRVFRDGRVYAWPTIDVSMPSAWVSAVFFDDPELLPRVVGRVELYPLNPQDWPGSGPMRYGTREEQADVRARMEAALRAWSDKPISAQSDPDDESGR